MGSGQARNGVGGSVGNKGGADTNTLTEAQMPSHSHYPRRVTADNQGGGSTSWRSFRADNAVGTSTTRISTTDTGGGQAHNNMQPTATVTKIIKT